MDPKEIERAEIRENHRKKHSWKPKVGGTVARRRERLANLGPIAEKRFTKYEPICDTPTVPANCPHPNCMHCADIREMLGGTVPLVVPQFTSLKHFTDFALIGPAAQLVTGATVRAQRRNGTSSGGLLVGDVLATYTHPIYGELAIADFTDPSKLE